MNTVSRSVCKISVVPVLQNAYLLYFAQSHDNDWRKDSQHTAPSHSIKATKKELYLIRGKTNHHGQSVNGVRLAIQPLRYKDLSAVLVNTKSIFDISVAQKSVHERRIHVRVGSRHLRYHCPNFSSWQKKATRQYWQIWFDTA